MGHSYQTNSFFPPIVFLTYFFIRHLPNKIKTEVGICWAGGKQFAAIYFEAHHGEGEVFQSCLCIIDNVVSSELKLVKFFLN